jgi:hypothetical protein
MRGLSDVVAKARGEAPPKPKGYQLPPPAEIDPCPDCGSRTVYRSPTDEGWACLGCRVRVGPPLLDIASQEGWQVAS